MVIDPVISLGIDLDIGPDIDPDIDPITGPGIDRVPDPVIAPIARRFYFTPSGRLLTMLPRLTLTPAADKFVRRILRFSGLPAVGLRLAVSAGGCSGYDAAFSAEAAPQPGEEELQINGLRFFLPAQSRLLLDGATMDFVDTPTRSGLSFSHSGQAPCACASAGGAQSGKATVAALAPVATIDVAAIGRGRPAALAASA